MSLLRSLPTRSHDPAHDVAARPAGARPRRRWQRAGLGVAALVAATLGGGGVVVPDARGAPLAAAIRLTPTEAEERIAEMADAAPAEQRAALVDGAVTEREYRAAVERTLSCLRRGATPRLGTAALQIHGPVPSSDGFALTYSYTVDGRADPAGALAAAAAVNELELACQDRHQRQVEDAFHLGRLADEGHVAAAVDGFTACVVAAEAVAPGGEVTVEVLAATEGPARAAVVQCLAEWPTVADGVAGARG